MKDYRDRSERDHYDRPSWSEIDKRKDRSKHVRDERQGIPQRKKVSTGYSRYKDELDHLFRTGKKEGMIKAILEKKEVGKLLDNQEAPKRQKLLRAIRDAVSERQVVEAIDRFVATYGDLPDDVEVLTQALVHEEDSVKESALRRLSKYLDGHIVTSRSLLIERVKYLAQSSDDDAVKNLAGEVKKKLGA